MPENKIMAQAKTIALDESVIRIIQNKQKELIAYAKDMGFDSPKKKELYNYIIRVHEHIDPADFFKKIKDEPYVYTTAGINGISRKIMERQLSILTEYAEAKSLPDPSFKALYNYLFRKLKDVNPNDFFFKS